MTKQSSTYYLNSSFFLQSVKSILTLLLCLFSLNISAQIKSASVSLSQDKIQLGEQITLDITVNYSVEDQGKVEIIWPTLQDTLSKEIEIVSQSEVKTTIPDSSNLLVFEQSKQIIITSFESGLWVIKPFDFSTNNDTNKISTEAHLITVATEDVDTTQAIKDIKEILDVNYTFIDWLKDNKKIVYGILAGIVLTLLIIYLYMKYYKKKPDVVEEVFVPKRPAHEIALEKLEALKAQKLWQEGKGKQYHIALSEIVREYIENRFNIPALEQTTEEILFGFRNVAIDEESKGKLKQVLILSDLVKFAKEQALPNENELSFSNTYDFIKGTQREEVKENENA